MTKRRNFPKAVREQIQDRATDAKGVLRCEGCHTDLTGKRTELDHVIAEALVPEWAKDSPLTAKDGQLLGECCHRGHDGKTKKDVKAAAKVTRIRKKDMGITRPKQSIQSRGFPKWQPKPNKIDKAAVDAAALPKRGGLFARIEKERENGY